MALSVGQQFGYIIFYNRNKKELKETLENLETKRKDVNRRVEEAMRNAYVIHEEVSKWLVDVENVIIHDEQSNANPSCFNLLQRYQLSKKAKKRATDICRLRGNSFVEVGYPTHLSYTKNTILPEGYQILESRTSTAKQIKDALAKPEVKKVGIYGMGGVGKTYLVNEVKKLVLEGEDRLFDVVIDLSVGLCSDVMQMQHQIGDILNKKLAKTVEGRAYCLRNALMEMEGRILITFDDLWKEFDFIKEVGIPLSKEGCKILVTTRDKTILTMSKINENDCFHVTCLDHEESQKFFMKIIGDTPDTIEKEIIAKELARECGGLPLALGTIAKQLWGKDINYWKDALSKLKSPIPLYTKDMSKRIYDTLALSYDYLVSNEAKLLFLLCSVFPEDYEISVKDLQLYAMSMRLFRMINSWEETRNRVLKLIWDLTSSSLLLDVNYEKDDKKVKMHDMVRAVARHIASKAINMNLLNYERDTSKEMLHEDKCTYYRAIFSNCKNFCKHLQNLKFPNLELLMLRFSMDVLDEYIEIEDTYFEGMEKLKVLDLENVHVPSSLWTSLKNLRMVCISSCECNDIDTIDHLKNLEVLKIISCKGITELPKTMSELKQLKVLVVFDCINLVVIHPNIISSMTKLEELDIQQCFKLEWGEEVEYENTWIQNAKLSELNYLPHLSILRLEISKVGNILSDTFSSKNLKKLREFFICVGTMRHIDTHNRIESLLNSNKYEKTLYLNMNLQIGSVDGIVFDLLLEGTEKLMIVNDSIGFGNDIFKAIGNDYSRQLKCLVIDGNSKMPHLLGSDFTSMESLVLNRMMILESIVPRHALRNPFNKLKVIKIESCKQLGNLFSFSIFKGLSNLQEIEVTGCDMIDGIVSIEIEDGTTICTSPLTSLHLKDVNKLTSFCTKLFIQQNPQPIIPFFDQQVSFHQLDYLSIEGGNNLEMLWHNKKPIGSSFSKLQTIEISDCNKLRCMFPSNMVSSLIFLDTLKIVSCELLETVFETENPTTLCDTKGSFKLRSLTLNDLPKLKYVWNKDVDDVFAFPNLTNVYVTHCPNLKSIFPASFTKYMKKIERLEVDGRNEIFPVDEALELEEVVFQSLRTLRTSYKQAVNERFWVMSKFPKLQRLTFVGCEDDDDVKMISLPIEMSEVLYNIEKLEIESCLQLVQVFGNDCYFQRCANLKKLKLCNLPKLLYVLKNDTNQMTTVTLFNLVHLEVGGCDGIKNLFSLSVAKNLVNLSSIKISCCERMTSIVAAPEEEEENGEIVFNKLTCLEFINLPRLAYFHSGKCTLKFPILNLLKIDECNGMKTFSYGITNTPTLGRIQIGNNNFPVILPTQGINEIIKSFFRQETPILWGIRNVELSLESVQRSYWNKPVLLSDLKKLKLVGSENDDIVCLPLEMSEAL